MPTEDAYSSGHLVLSHFGTCMCSNVETNLSWACLVSGLLSFEHPSVLLFCFQSFIRTSDPFSSVVKSGIPLNQRLTPAEPTPASAERRFINARAIAKPTLGTARYRSNQIKSIYSPSPCGTEKTYVHHIYKYHIM